MTPSLKRLVEQVLDRIPRKNPFNGSLPSDWDVVNERVEIIVEIDRFPENPDGIGRAQFSLSVLHEGKHTIELASSKLKDFSDNAIMGVIAHELGHVLVVYHYGHDEEYDIEAMADECAELMGFEVEIKAMYEEKDR